MLPMKTHANSKRTRMTMRPLQHQLVPVTVERVVRCLRSAELCHRVLGEVAQEAQTTSKRWVWTGVACSAIVTLGVWPTIAASSAWPAIAAVSLVAFVSALAAAVPRLLGYDETAKEAASLQSAYGHMIGELTDLLTAMRQPSPPAYVQTAARRTVAAFEELKSRKDALTLAGARAQHKTELA
jgi:hypothetical protein